MSTTTATRQPAPAAAPTSTTPDVDADLVDRIFDYLRTHVPDFQVPADQLDQAKAAVRAEFGGDRAHIRKRSTDLGSKILARFNGRNATEVARSLNISRGTVYRHLKQAGEA